MTQRLPLVAVEDEDQIIAWARDLTACAGTIQGVSREDAIAVYAESDGHKDIKEVWVSPSHKKHRTIWASALAQSGEQSTLAKSVKGTRAYHHRTRRIQSGRSLRLDLDHIYPAAMALKEGYCYVRLHPAVSSANRGFGSGIERSWASGAGQVELFDDPDATLEINALRGPISLNVFHIAKQLGFHFHERGDREAEGREQELSRVFEDSRLRDDLLRELGLIWWLDT